MTPITINGLPVHDTPPPGYQVVTSAYAADRERGIFATACADFSPEYACLVREGKRRYAIWRRGVAKVPDSRSALKAKMRSGLDGWGEM